VREKQLQLFFFPFFSGVSENKVLFSLLKRGFLFEAAEYSPFFPGKEDISLPPFFFVDE